MQTIRRRKALNRWIVSKDVKNIRSMSPSKTDCFFLGALTLGLIEVLAAFVAKLLNINFGV